MEFYTVFVLDNTKRTIHDEMIFKSVMTFPISKAKNLALLFLLLVPLLIKAALMPFMSLIYDEVAYSWTANRLVMHGGWIDIYGVRDLFFWPPLFNYLAAFPIAFGADRLYAVRIITLIISSLIPPLFYLLILHSGYRRPDNHINHLFLNSPAFLSPYTPLWLRFTSCMAYSSVVDCQSMGYALLRRRTS